MLAAGVSDDVAFALILKSGEVKPHVSCSDNVMFESCREVKFALADVNVNVVKRKHRMYSDGRRRK